MGGNPRKNPVTDEQIIECYLTLRSGQKTAAALGIGDSTVLRVLTRHEVPRTGLSEFREKITRFRGQEPAIRAAYDAGATYDELRGQFGEASDYALKHAIKRAGGELRENPAPLLKDGELDRMRELHAAGMGQMRISLALGRSQSFVSRAMRRFGIAPKEERGAKHGHWKGGRYMTQGYWRAMVTSADSLACMANQNGYVLEHRLVMARKLGRPLLKGETVHHIDGVRSNNAPENLQLRQGKHGKHIAMCCLDCGSHRIGPAPLKDVS